MNGFITIECSTAPTTNVTTFNSIEWIHGLHNRVSEEALRKAFNSIEWIHMKKRELEVVIRELFQFH